MNGGDQPVAGTTKVMVCHPQPLIAAAAAAILRHSGAAGTVTVVATLSRMLSGLNDSVHVAVVFDSVEEDLAELFVALRYRGLSTPVVIVAEHPRPDRTVAAIEMGAAGMVPANCGVALLCRSVVEAGRGHTSFALGQQADVMKALQARRLQRRDAQCRLAELSVVERDVLAALANGTPVTVIARRMSVSPRTARSYVHRVGAKLGAHGQLRIAAAGRQLLSEASVPPGYARAAKQGVGA